MSKKKRIIIIVALILVVMILLSIGAFLLFMPKYNYKEITSKPEELGFEEVIDDRIINVALFGIDSREVTTNNSYKGNADTVMVMSVHTKTKKVKIISIMRDSLVPIERSTGIKYYKLNAAYSWGGPELAIKTINQNFNLDISEYATINFYGLADIIDALGGVDIELTEKEVTIRGENNHGINDYIDELCENKKLNANDYYVNTAGVHHLNGIQAVAYSRQRYCENIFGTNNDYGRTDRQRYVLEQLFNKVKGLSKSEYLKLIPVIFPNLETSFSLTEIMDVGLNFMLSSPMFEQYRIPQNSSDMNFLMPAPSGNFGSVVYYDLAYASKLINAIIYEDMTIENFVSQNPIEKNDWYNKR